MPTKGRPVKIGTPIASMLVCVLAGAVFLFAVSLVLQRAPCDGFWLGMRMFFNVACG